MNMWGSPYFKFIMIGVFQMERIKTIETRDLVESIENVSAMWVLPDGTQVYSSGFENFTFDYE